ncbi:tripartite tricarboxylate transporter permease [Georgenia sp. 10Sc9-8]|uniref:Tripartite tricarboxylate transporter permease n=1 Tax=Georgenia halotolerans TaxID=3028317 RepID=A0ABT5U0H2_9MICO|nr:tripartite tricarboxylate transporter permease [Georgenia halotolerans]
MLEVAQEAIGNILEPAALLYLCLGVAVGCVVGLLPGLGGIVGLSLLLPFIFGMEPTHGMALLTGMFAITATSDTFPSVLLGVPGSSASQATVLDGYPLSQQGRGAEALASGLFSSMLGGIFGAAVMFFAITTARPLILAFGSAELFMLTILGLSMVALLSKGAPRLGLLAGAIGLLLGSVGGAPTHPVYRFSFDQVYLFDGIPLAILAIGLFAIPELVDLLAAKRSVAKYRALEGSVFGGMKATLRNLPLVGRSASIGAGIGILPGLGGSVGHWLAYGVASQTSKNRGKFGKGDVRGVIASESANNASEGGALIPTLMFGIPGSGSMAILLGGLTLMGMQPGPSMVTRDLPLSVSIAWMLALANVLATALTLLLAKHIAKITIVPAYLFAPFLFVLLFVASYQSTRHWGDIISLVVIGGVGWVMKQIGVPRAPLLIGFVLSVPAERYLWTSMGTYGFSWLLHPIVIGIAVAIALLLWLGLRVSKSVEETTAQASNAGERGTPSETHRDPAGRTDGKGGAEQ